MNVASNDIARRPWVAALLGGVVPGLGHLFRSILIGVALHIAIWIATIASAVVLARRKRASYPLTRYNHLALYMGFALATWVASNALAEYVRGSILEPFRIPSGSMVPTLIPGDQVLATKVGSGEARQRGDVVVFTNPLRPEVDFIQRIIGLPGDRIRIENARIYLNGEEQLKRLVEPWYAIHLDFDRETESGQLYEEVLTARRYRILERTSL